MLRRPKHILYIIKTFPSGFDIKLSWLENIFDLTYDFCSFAKNDCSCFVNVLILLIHHLLILGSFKRQDFLFHTYVPATRVVEESQVPGEMDIMDYGY